MQKTAKTPYRSISIITLDRSRSEETNKTTSSRTSETIFTGDAVFVRSGGGHWRKIDAALSTLQDLVRKASSNLGNCQDLGSVKLGETLAGVFSADQGVKAYGTTTKLWVDKARGVLVRSETDTKTKEGSRHSVIEYIYGSVAAPQL